MTHLHVVSVVLHGSRKLQPIKYWYPVLETSSDDLHIVGSLVGISAGGVERVVIVSESVKLRIGCHCFCYEGHLILVADHVARIEVEMDSWAYLVVVYAFALKYTWHFPFLG